MNDVAFIFMGRSAQDVAAKVAKKLEAITAFFAKFGLKLNFRPKKTEIIFTARGREAGDMADVISLDVAGDSFLQCRAQKVRIVSDYIHLGSCIQASGALGVEVARGTHDAQAAYLALAKRAVGAQETSTQTRVSLSKSLILSKLIYGAEAWGEITPGQMAKLEAHMTRVYRMIAAEFRGPLASARQISRCVKHSASPRLRWRSQSEGCAIWQPWLVLRRWPSVPYIRSMVVSRWIGLRWSINDISAQAEGVKTVRRGPRAVDEALE